MIDPRVLERYKSTTARLKEVFTATVPENYKDLTDEEKKKNDKDIANRKKIEELVRDRLYESISFGLQNHQIYSAVDLAWDSTPINKSTIPLTLYATGKLDMGQCASSLAAAGLSKYVTKDEKGFVQSIDIPKFFEVQVNLIRSILTRRLAAQSNKYANLWPFYKFESRSTSLVGKLRADIMSQRLDIMADQYDYRHHEVQVMREMLMYAVVADFIRSSWEKEKQEAVIAQEPGLETGEVKTEVRVVKEGLCFVNPHPSRVFWDTAHPLVSLNSDIGCEWAGYWDVQRYRDVQMDTNYWNRDKISYSSNVVGLFSTYAQYFSQYYCTITPPATPNIATDLTSGNDLKNSIGYYASDQGDTAIVFSNFFWKIVPKEWGIGDYPHPVWLRLIVASDNSIQFAEFLPSSPAAIASYNANDSRRINISLAHELMGFQDQLTNLLSYLLLCLQADNVKVLVVDTDLVTPENLKAFREQLKGQSAYTGTTVLEVSRSKLADIGITNPDQVVKLVETKSTALDIIFRAIGQLIQLVERLAALSPQEQGQPAPREISATETNLIAGTTESVYGFISDSIDEYRAAKKRIIYESYIAMGEQEFRCPVANRYPKSVIEAAGLKAEEGEDLVGTPGKPDRFTILGTKDKLEHDYIFTSRDGAERPVNTQAANVLVQLLSTVISMPPILQAMKKDKLFEIVNEIFRQSGAGIDLKLEMEPGEDNALGPDPNEVMKKLQGLLEGLTQASERNQQEIEQIKSAIEPVLKVFAGAAGPQQQPSPMQGMQSMQTPAPPPGPPIAQMPMSPSALPQPAMAA